METILVADDETIERMVLQKKIKKFFPEYEVVSAANGREVVENYHRYVPAAMILDIEMPGKSGLQAAEEIRREDRLVSIIFLTAFNEFSYAKKAVSLHATDYLLKPCDDRELIAAMEEALRVQNEIRMYTQTQPDEPGVGNAGPMTDRANEESADGTDAVLPYRADDRTEGNERDGEVHEAILNYIRGHYGEDLSVQVMSDHFGYADAYFCKIFKQHFGRSFVTFLTEFRIERAKEFLDATDGSIRDIGRAVGYPDANYFAKVFKRITGISPTEYRSSGT